MKKPDSPIKPPEKVRHGSTQNKKIEELPDFYGESQPEDKQVMVDEDEVYWEDEPKIEDEDPFEGDSNAHF